MGSPAKTASTPPPTSDNAAPAIPASINAKGGGYSAPPSSSRVPITGPASAAGATPAVTETSGTMTWTANTFTNIIIGATSAFSSNGTMTTTVTSFPPPGVMTVAITAFSPFAKVIVSATSGPGGTDERQNFANWFTYYRIRIAMMKSGLGRAFAGIGSNYHVGFMTIYATPSGSSSAGYLAINDYTTT